MNDHCRFFCIISMIALQATDRMRVRVRVCERGWTAYARHALRTAACTPAPTGRLRSGHRSSWSLRAAHCLGARSQGPYVLKPQARTRASSHLRAHTPTHPPTHWKIQAGRSKRGNDKTRTCPPPSPFSHPALGPKRQSAHRRQQVRWPARAAAAGSATRAAALSRRPHP